MSLALLLRNAARTQSPAPTPATFPMLLSLAVVRPATALLPAVPFTDAPILFTGNILSITPVASSDIEVAHGVAVALSANAPAALSDIEVAHGLSVSIAATAPVAACDIEAAHGVAVSIGAAGRIATADIETVIGVAVSIAAIAPVAIGSITGDEVVGSINAIGPVALSQIQAFQFGVPPPAPIPALLPAAIPFSPRVPLELSSIPQATAPAPAAPAPPNISSSPQATAPSTNSGPTPGPQLSSAPQSTAPAPVDPNRLKPR